MRFQVRELNIMEVTKGLQLIEQVFDEFVAPDYSDEGIKFFKNVFINGEDFLAKFKSGAEIMYGAFAEEELVGCVSVNKKNKISCFFVKGIYHKKGVGKILFKQIEEEMMRRNERVITLNASPFAIGFYKKLGFTEVHKENEFNGIRYTEMEYYIE